MERKDLLIDGIKGCQVVEDLLLKNLAGEDNYKELKNKINFMCILLPVLKQVAGMTDEEFIISEKLRNKKYKVKRPPN